MPSIMFLIEYSKIRSKEIYSVKIFSFWLLKIILLKLFFNKSWI